MNKSEGGRRCRVRQLDVGSSNIFATFKRSRLGERDVKCFAMTEGANVCPWWAGFRESCPSNARLFAVTMAMHVNP